MKPRNEMTLLHDRVVRVALTQGQVAIIDLEDAELVGRHRWYARWDPCTRSYYAVTEGRAGGRRKPLLMHRLISGLDFGDPLQGDHIYHRTLDNRRSQLRVVSNRQNQQNRRDGSSQYPGISWHRRDRRWQAYIYVDGKRRHLGNFRTEQDAAEAYKYACSLLGVQ